MIYRRSHVEKSDVQINRRDVQSFTADRPKVNRTVARLTAGSDLNCWQHGRMPCGRKKNPASTAGQSRVTEWCLERERDRTAGHFFKSFPGDLHSLRTATPGIGRGVFSSRLSEPSRRFLIARRPCRIFRNRPNIAWRYLADDERRPARFGGPVASRSMRKRTRPTVSVNGA